MNKNTISIRNDMGMVKTKEEIDKLRKAAVLGEGCFKNVCKKIKIGMTEKDISSIVHDFFVKKYFLPKIFGLDIVT